MYGCLVKIRQGLNSFSPAEMKLGEYILNNEDSLTKLSITELAERSGVSEASIVRFCKRLGLKGYQELKVSISAETAVSAGARKNTIYDDIGIRDCASTILQKISKGNIDAIDNTLKVLDALEMDKAINAIHGAKRILLFGNGASSIVALDAQYKFTRINMEALMYFDTHMQLTVASNARAGDVAIAISNSGRTIDVVKCLEMARGKGAKTICITQYGDSEILDVSDIKLFTACAENSFRSGAMASRIAQLNIIDSLFVGVACKNYDEVVDYLDSTREAVRNKKY